MRRWYTYDPTFAVMVPANTMMLLFAIEFVDDFFSRCVISICLIDESVFYKLPQCNNAVTPR